MAKVTSVYVFGNGMMMVFDENGVQMPKYQGPVEKCIDALRKVYDGPVIAAQWPNRRK